MARKYTDAEYAALLPKKQTGTSVLFFDALGRLLIVKPNYKDGWSVPGGSADVNESPLHCALREVKEEIGLDVKKLDLVGISYMPKHYVFSDSLKFVFHGGTLTEKQIKGICLQTEELDQFDFATVEKAMELLSPSLKSCLSACLEAIKNGKFAYCE
jgi:8-oxo-dGTP pyrophosphatase MutT (NUDIX family)